LKSENFPKHSQFNPPNPENNPDWTTLHTIVHQTLRQRQLLSKNDRILVAVSGGQDSLCLAKLLLDLRRKWHWQLAIAHCDHRWRPDSAANAEYVGQLADDWDLPFYFAKAGENSGINSEAKARQWRYQVLTEMAEQHDYAIIALGHTQSDRAETLLFNLMRGTGADGLQSLTWQRPLKEKIQLVRPLLEISRSQTGDFCREADISIWEDSTNQDLKYARNRIRQELLPYLAAKFNPQVEPHLRKQRNSCGQKSNISKRSPMIYCKIAYHKK
jgi:tRNA(Ile)-lysidine synthase